jgi:arylsulfatase A-like enzyme
MPSETGVNHLHPPASIRAGMPNIGEWLGTQAGYDCVYAGKWHVPACHSYHIPGFRVLASGQDHRGDVSDVTVSHAAEAFLRGRKGRQPFLFVASLTQPHDICDWLRLNQQHKKVPPIPVSRAALPPLPGNFRAMPTEAEYVRRYRVEKCEPNIGGWDTTEWRWYLWNYYRMVEMADAELGRILRALEASGQAENTLVIFTSDHGEGMGEHRLDRKNFHYEAAIKVPLVFSWPGRLPRHVVNRRALVSGIDLMPTMCGFAGIDPPPLTTAVNLRPVLEGRTRETRPCLAVEMSVRATGRVLRTPDFKYAAFANDGVEQLFDMKNDPGETRNLAGRAPFRDILESHRQRLAEWERKLDRSPDAEGAGLFARDRGQDRVTKETP